MEVTSASPAKLRVPSEDTMKLSKKRSNSNEVYIHEKVQQIVLGSRWYFPSIIVSFISLSCSITEKTKKRFAFLAKCFPGMKTSQ